MTSTTLQRSWLWVVSRSLSIISSAVFIRYRNRWCSRCRDIVVDRARHADARNALARKRLRAAERTVAAAADQAVDAQVLAGVGRLLETLLGHHFLAAGGVQHGAALADDAVNAACAHLDDVAVDQTAVAAADAENGMSFADALERPSG